MVDGKGAERVTDVLTKCSEDDYGKEPSLRAVRKEDAFLLWQWANEPEVRSNSFHSDAISWEDHLKWFEKKLSAPETRIWILEERHVPVGQIRYDRIGNADTAEISFTVSLNYRGRGIGQKLLAMTADQARTELEVGSFRGIVFKKNLASRRIFTNAGFDQIAESVISGFECLIFQRAEFGRG